MRLSAAICAIAVMGWASAMAAPAQRHDDFVVAFPAAPKVQADGETRRYVDDEMNVIFEVDVVSGGLDAAAGRAADLRRLEAFGRRNGAVMRSSQPIVLSGQPATEALFVNSSGAQAVVRTAAFGGRGYVVAYHYAKDQGSDTERDLFLNSFRFVP
jgi:hypothetical protein